MHRTKYGAATLALMWAWAASAAESMDLVRGGQPTCSIVIAEDAGPSVRLAAMEIQYHVLKISGAEIPIRTAAEVIADGRILVGESQATRALGLRADDFLPQEYAIISRPDTIVLMGRDGHPADAERERPGIPMAGGDTLPQTRHRIHYWKAVGLPDRDTGECELPGIYDEQGTCLATYDFLERHLGVRWYGPNEMGLITPSLQDLTVRVEEVKRSPALKLRLGLASGNWPFLQKQWGQFTPEQVQLHWRRLRLGGERWSGNHTFHRQTIAAAFSDPQYQCQNRRGQGSQLCYTNRKLIEQVAQMARDYFDGRGTLPAGWKALGDYFAIVPDDNSHFCTCPACRKLLGQENRKHTGCFNTGEASHYWFTFVNEVAREVRRTHPDKYLATLAYWLYALPPDFELEPNVSVAPCVITCTFPPNAAAEANDMGMYRQWLTKTKAPMFMWIYYHHPMEPALIQNWKCFPHIMVHPTAEYAKEFIRNGLRGIYVCGEQEQLEHYVMTKVWDDPETDVDALIDEFFRLYFGAAAEPMQRFYLQLEQIACDRANYPPETRRKDITDWRRAAWKHLGTAERMEELGNFIDSAAQAATTEPEKQRVALWRHAFWDWMQAGRAEYLAEVKE